MTDPTVLAEAAQDIADVLEAGAAQAGWAPEVCVTIGEPAVSCDSILVWVSRITPSVDNQRCQVATTVTFSYFLASCIGGDVEESCEWWAERSPDHLDRIWPVWVHLVDSVMSGTLCDAECSDITLRDLVPVPAAEFGMWQGSVDVVLSPRAGS